MDLERENYADPSPPLVPVGTVIVLVLLAVGSAALVCGLGLAPLFRP